MDKVKTYSTSPNATTAAIYAANGMFLLIASAVYTAANFVIGTLKRNTTNVSGLFTLTASEASVSKISVVAAQILVCFALVFLGYTCNFMRLPP